MSGVWGMTCQKRQLKAMYRKFLNIGTSKKLLIILKLEHLALSGLIRVREMLGNLLFFQGQGIVREFHDVSGKNEILPKCQGFIREFSYSSHEC